MWWNLAKIILTPFPQPQIAAKQSLDGPEMPKNIHFHFFEKCPHDHVNSVSFYHTLSRYWEDITKSWKIKLFNWQKISTSRIKPIWKRNTTATNATTQPLRPATWKGTSWFIVVRSLSRAHSASILVQKLAAYKIPPHPLRGESFQMQTMQLFLQNSWQPQGPPAHAFRWESFQLCTVQLLGLSSW